MRKISVHYKQLILRGTRKLVSVFLRSLQWIWERFWNRSFRYDGPRSCLSDWSCLSDSKDCMETRLKTLTVVVSVMSLFLYKGVHGLLTPVSPIHQLSPWLPSFYTEKSAEKVQTFFPSSAVNTIELPSFATIRHLQIGNLFHIGVFSTEYISQGTRLGPFAGKVLQMDQIDRSKDDSSSWEVQFFLSNFS